MIEILLSLCLGGAEGPCVPHVVPVGAESCAAAEAAAAPRLAAWRQDYRVEEVRCGPAPPPQMDFAEVAPGVFVHQGIVAEATAGNGGDIANVGFIIGDAAVAVIDTGGARAEGEAVVQAVRARTDLPIRYLILTHMHPDHVFGATALADAGAEVVGHARLQRALAARRDSYVTAMTRLVGPGFAGSEIPRVDRAVDGEVTLDLGGRALVVESWPVAHTETDVTVFDPATGTFFAGDLVFATHVPALDGSLRGWQAAMDALAARDLARVVPGHGPATLDWPEGLAPQRRYLDVLAQDVSAAIEAGLTIGETAERAAASEAGHWALFDAFNARNATTAYTELEWE